MKKIAFYTLVLLGVLSFVACSGDNEAETPAPDIILVTSISLNASSIEVTVDGSRALTATISPTNASNKHLDWSSSNTSIATVSTAGVVTGVAEGTTVVTCAASDGSGVSAKCTVTVKAAGGETTYTAPTYKDYYLDVNDWGYSKKWNLANVHDPSVVLADDGYYYMYQTDASYGNVHNNHGHFFCRRSANLVDWEFLGATMMSSPIWVKDSLNSIRARQGLDPINNPTYGFWAPCVRKVKTNLYRMYYCIVVDNYIKTGKINTPENFDNSWSERAFIGVMETNDPASNQWEDKGFVICSSTERGTNWKRTNNSTDWSGYFYYNSIDPSYIITPSGEHWLIYGSWHSGFSSVQINSDTGKTKQTLGESWTNNINDLESNGYGKTVYTRQLGNRWQASEAPEVIYRDGYYYMFIAYDELSVAYNTRVVRSTSIDGPYKDITGLDVTNQGGEAYPILTHPYKFGNDHGWVGISHCAVFDDGKGNWYYASQQRFPANYAGNAYSNAVMLGGVRSIVWTSDGWPLVLPERYGAVPQSTISESDLVGNWQHINMVYSYQKQSTSVDITLTADHKVSSDSKWSANASWSYDASKQVLTIGTTQLYLKRELDWESSPRVPTIVYVGLSKDGKTTYWGKKVD